MLLDTDVVGASRKPERNSCVVAWLREQTGVILNLPGPVVGELSYGIRLVELPARRMMYEEWLKRILATHPVVPMEVAAWALFGEMRARPALQGFSVTAPGTRKLKYRPT